MTEQITMEKLMGYFLNWFKYPKGVSLDNFTEKFKEDYAKSEFKRIVPMVEKYVGEISIDGVECWYDEVEEDVVDAMFDKLNKLADVCVGLSITLDQAIILQEMMYRAVNHCEEMKICDDVSYVLNDRMMWNKTEFDGLNMMFSKMF